MISNKFGTYLTTSAEYEMKVTCASVGNASACNKNTFYAAAFGKDFVLNCYGIGCFNIGQFYNNGYYDYRYAHIYVNGCGVCSRSEYCMGANTLNCGYSPRYTNQFYVGSTTDNNGCYSGSQINCDCTSLAQQTTDGFIDDIQDPYCS